MHDSIRQAMTNIAQGRPAYAPPAPPVPIYDEPDMAPKELEAFIHDHGIIGQNEAVKAAALICYRHFVLRNASVSLFCGPTGSGKTEIWRVLAREFPQIYIFDSSNLSNEGWKGSNKLSLHFRAMDPRIRDKCILVFDEFDKMLETKMSGDMNVSESVQSECLRLFDHDRLFFGADRNDEQSLTVDCKHVSCVLLGAFDNLMKSKSKVPVSMGFGGTPKKTTISYDTTDITYSDLRQFTQIRDEICGRIDRITCLKPLSVHDHIRILLNYIDTLSKNTGCNITVDLATLRDIASKAVTMPFGARWAKARVSALLDEMVYEEPFETRYVYCQNKERTVTAHDERNVDTPY